MSDMSQRQKRGRRKATLGRLVEESVMRSGQQWEIADIRRMFGYSPHTYILDTWLWKFGLIQDMGDVWMFTGEIKVRTRTRWTDRQLAELPPWQKAFIRSSTDEVVR